MSFILVLCVIAFYDPRFKWFKSLLVVTLGGRNLLTGPTISLESSKQDWELMSIHVSLVCMTHVCAGRSHRKCTISWCCVVVVYAAQAPWHIVAHYTFHPTRSLIIFRISSEQSAGTWGDTGIDNHILVTIIQTSSERKVKNKDSKLSLAAYCIFWLLSF